ncbi:MAG: endonuclease [Thermoleophilia bacterium]|nr:endonuclease [Thermoleophilia bacterium]
MTVAQAPVRTAASTAPIATVAATNAASLSARSELTAQQGPAAAQAAAGAAGGLDEYYAPAQGKTGADLLYSLYTIVRTGHVDRGYSQAREELFSEVDDPDGNNQIADVFTGVERGPITGKGDGFAKGMNTEHTWAQSKGATGIAQSDLHHLRASDIDTNSRRASFPYGNVTTSEWSTGEGVHQARLGTDSLGWTVFEPAPQFKGDIARGLLYFYTRYNASRTNKYTDKDFIHEVPTLIKWAQEDPVDAAEITRNNTVQKFQGNRNPYIDHPEFIAAVDFMSVTKQG